MVHFDRNGLCLHGIDDTFCTRVVAAGQGRLASQVAGLSSQPEWEAEASAAREGKEGGREAELSSQARSVPQTSDLKRSTRCNKKL
jgi:hypothetical protein